MELVRPVARARSAWRDAASLASIGAGVVHITATDAHLTEWFAAGVFMAVTGIAQLGWGLAIVARPSAVVAAVGVALNGAIVAVWLASRTTGMPYGPDAFMPEPIRASDGLATLLELVVIVGAVRVGARARTGGEALLALSLAGMVFAVFIADPGAPRGRPAATAALALATLGRAWIVYLRSAKEAS